MNSDKIQMTKSITIMDENQNSTLQYDEYVENQQRAAEEELTEIESATPPTDIVAFNELRSCADIYRMYVKGQIDIKPDFQRGEVWTTRAQTLFIDSLMKQLPIPSLCISLDVHSQKRLVIDGLQRITTIIKFLEEDPDKDFRLYKTDQVDIRISGKKVSQIRKESPQLCEILENVTIPVTILRCDYSKKDHMHYLYQIFYRLNSGGNKLFNQEIRNCIYQGSFNTFLKNYVRSHQWLQFYNTTEEKVEKARFRNEEILLRFFAFNNNISQYTGNLSSFLNDFMDDNKNANEGTIQMYQDLISQVINIAMSIKQLSTSKNVREAVMIGIAKNIDKLKDTATEQINRTYESLMLTDIFASEELQDALLSKEKVTARINAAIDMFAMI